MYLPRAYPPSARASRAIHSGTLSAAQTEQLGPWGLRLP